MPWLARFPESAKMTDLTYVLPPRCLTSLLRETGGLLTLEATSLLRMVLQKLLSVLLERNLKSCDRQTSQNKKSAGMRMDGTYPDEEVLIKILAFRVLLGLVLDSTSFVQIDSLCSQKRSVRDRYSQRSHLFRKGKESPTIFPCAYINNKITSRPSHPKPTLK